MNKVYTLETVDINKVQPNKGQIEGVPRNARVIRGERFEALCKAIEDDPSTISVYEIIVYPLGDQYIAIGGNMRLRACKKLGMQTIPCKILNPETPKEKLVEISLKDNAQFSEIDLEIAQDAFTIDKLLDYGVEIPLEEDVPDEVEQTESEPEPETETDDEPEELNRIIIVFPNGEKDRVERLFGCSIPKPFIELDEILALQKQNQ